MRDQAGVLFLDDDEDLRDTFADLVRTVFDRDDLLGAIMIGTAVRRPSSAMYSSRTAGRRC